MTRAELLALIDRSTLPLIALAVVDRLEKIGYGPGLLGDVTVIEQRYTTMVSYQ